MKANLLEFLKFILSVPVAIVGIYWTIRQIQISKRKWINCLPNIIANCQGRHTEIKKIRKRILNCESEFIHGSAGVGKTTVVLKAISKIRKFKLKQKYDGGILYYNFYENPAFNDMCNQFVSNINGDPTKSLQTLLNEKKYLIVLEGCEKTNDLKKIIQISSNPVFLITSRDKAQFLALKPYLKNPNIGIEIGVLDDVNSLKLIRKISNKYTNKKYDSLLLKVASLLGNLPLALYLASNDRLFNDNIVEFVDLLNKNGARIINEKEKRVFDSEKENVDLLIRRSLGLSSDSKACNLSNEAKTLLGLLGCVSYQEFLLIPEYFGLDELDKLIYELSDYHLIIYDNRFVKPKHALIYSCIHDNAFKLLENNNALFSYIKILGGVSVRMESDKSKSYYKFILSQKSHLLSVLTILINQFDKQDVKNEIETIGYCCFLLSRLGFYSEIEHLIKIAEEKLKEPLSNSGNDVYYWFLMAKVYIFMGLNNQDECIKLLKEHVLFTKTNPEYSIYSELAALSNLLVFLTKFKMYSEGVDIILEIEKLKEKSSIDIYDDEVNDTWINAEVNILELYVKVKVPDEKTINFIRFILNRSIDKVGRNDKDTIDIMITLAIALFQNGEFEEAVKYIQECIAIIQETFTFEDPESLEDLENIANFFAEIDCMEQAKDIYFVLLEIANSKFGNNHAITVQYRLLYDKAEEYFKTHEYDSNKVFFVIANRNPKLKLYKNIANKFLHPFSKS